MKRFLAAGTPRSGTTLLQQILMAHPDGVSISETHFFNEAEQDVLFSESATPRDKWDHLESQKHVQVLTNVLTPEELDRLTERSNDMVDLFVRIMDHYAEQENGRYWVEKTPTHLARFPRLFRAQQALSGILITRNPLDTCASLLGKPWTADDIEENAKRWLADNTLITLLVDARPHEITLIRYEDLVTNPEEEIKTMCDFLDIEFDEAMLHPEDHAEELTFRWEEWKENNYRPINDSAIGKHQETLNDTQIQTVRTITAPLSNRLHGTDYPVTPFWEETFQEIKTHYMEQVQPLK